MTKDMMHAFRVFVALLVCSSASHADHDTPDEESETIEPYLVLSTLHASGGDIRGLSLGIGATLLENVEAEIAIGMEVDDRDRARGEPRTRERESSAAVEWVFFESDNGIELSMVLEGSRFREKESVEDDDDDANEGESDVVSESDGDGDDTAELDIDRESPDGFHYVRSESLTFGLGLAHELTSSLSLQTWLYQERERADTERLVANGLAVELSFQLMPHAAIGVNASRLDEPDAHTEWGVSLGFMATPDLSIDISTSHQIGEPSELCIEVVRSF